jgi:hypothetical protein
MPLDWTKPIQFENGEPCELLATNADGWKQWGSREDGSYPTRHIHRLDIDESTMGGAMSAYWFMHEDGKSNWPGYNVVNTSEAPRLHAVVFQEGEWWVGQCVEKDIAVQAKSFDGVKEEFRRTLEAYREIGKEKGLMNPLEHHPVTPPSVIQKLQGQRIDIGEV